LVADSSELEVIPIVRFIILFVMLLLAVVLGFRLVIVRILFVTFRKLAIAAVDTVSTSACSEVLTPDS